MPQNKHIPNIWTPLSQVEEAQNLQQSIWNLKPTQEKIAYELLTFLFDKMPSVESHTQRLHLYQLSPELQREFKHRLIEKGLIKI
jgi:hypothetical protein